MPNLNRLKLTMGAAVLTMLLWLSALYSAGHAEAATNMPGYEEAARSKHLVLYYNGKTGAIAVEDRRTGYVWKSVVDEDVYEMSQVGEVLRTYSASIVAINYVDTASKKSINLNKIYSADKANSIHVTRISGGVTIGIDFTSIGISLVVEVALDDDKLQIRIPADKIKQTRNMGIASLELLPFFGATGVVADGYMFYPDGSGALTRYDRKEQRPQKSGAMKLHIYSNEEVKVNSPSSMDDVDSYDAMLPVFGIKNGNNAVLFAGTQGEEDAWINVRPDGYSSVNLNRIGFEFTYRHLYEVSLSRVTVFGIAGSEQTKMTRTDKEMIHSDREVKLFFLTGDMANYSGMANVYRDYLIDRHLLNKSVQDHDPVPLGLDLFMGITEKRILFDKFIAMTKFNDAREIVEGMKQEGAGMIEVMLMGWSKGGYGKNGKSNGKPESKLGGNKGLQLLTKYMNDKQLRLYLTNNLMQASKSGGFSVKKEVARSGGNVPISNPAKSLYLLNPFIAADRAAPFLSQINRYGSVGVAFGGLGNMIYHDYNKKNTAGRAKTLALWDSMLQEAVNEQKRIAVEGGNQYVLKYASRLYGIPLAASHNRITDEAVPFYQMVVHGMIPYSSEPGNLSYDLKVQKLKWVEYGSMPSFELTYKKSVHLKNTAYNSLFTSYYKDWTKQAVDISREFNERLQSVWDQTMIRHEQVAYNVFKVEYRNGTAVYINYNTMDDFPIGGHTVKALDYLVVKPGGERR